MQVNRPLPEFTSLGTPAMPSRSPLRRCIGSPRRCSVQALRFVPQDIS